MYASQPCPTRPITRGIGKWRFISRPSVRPVAAIIARACILPTSNIEPTRWHTSSLRSVQRDHPLERLEPTSPFSTVELFQVGFVRVVDTTYFGIELNLSANSPSLDGQAAANPS